MIFSAFSDNDRIEMAIAARGADGIVLIPPRVCDAEPERTYWLLDRAVLLPENTTVILQNCKIKLSDACRDNFFRSANCGLGIEDPERIFNIHIRGEGMCVLEGADHPRATGDGSKVLACPCPYTPEDLCRLADWIPEERRSPDKIEFWDMHDHSYGTDAGKEDESQFGDWRGIGVLLANVEHFSIENLQIVASHGWGISMEACAFGRVEKIHFDAYMFKVIDGMANNMENQDGVDIRNGCHHITVCDITGHTGDDVIALTAIADKSFLPGGSLCTTHVMHNDWSRRERDIHDIVIRNIVAATQLCLTLRLLACDTHIYNVVIDGIIDVVPDWRQHWATIGIGEGDGSYGKNLPDGVSNITINNVICHGQGAITVGGYLKDSVISNVVNRNPNCGVLYAGREKGLSNVITNNLCTVTE